jgi:hypothetical protein
LIHQVTNAVEYHQMNVVDRIVFAESYAAAAAALEAAASMKDDHHPSEVAELSFPAPLLPDDVC